MLGIQANIPTLLWGDPGVGKTSTIYQASDELDAHLEVLIASIREPTDFGGLPIKTATDEVTLAPMGWAKRVREASDAGRISIVFIDEISTAPPANQAALLRVVFDKVVGDLNLVGTKVDNVRFVGAANPPEKAAGGWDLAAPLANRWFHVEWTLDPDTWVNGYMMGWPKLAMPRLPHNWEAEVDMQKAITAGYIMTQPQDLVAVPTEDGEAGRAWPSPRSWTMCDRLLTAAEAAQLKDAKLAIIKGTVGEKVSKKFYTYMRDLDLPRARDLLDDPTLFNVPNRPDQTYAILTAVVTEAKKSKKDNDYLNAWKILGRAAIQASVDIACGAAKNLAEYGLTEAMPDPDDLMEPFIPMLKEAGVI